MPKVTIDGTEIEVPADASLLQMYVLTMKGDFHG
jgi:NADH dehydrogenase/NADH:ubiquinone oxidoreductase subunit G